MLVLSRCLGERIVIGEGADQVVLTIVDIDYSHGAPRAKLGIVARPEVSVRRAEVLAGVKEPQP